jgi:murein DD-endopeptidase MepM/ murein hydrolase activator NlpD
MEIILRQPLAKPSISQEFGNNLSLYDPATELYYYFYKKYGLDGHPGVDYACPVGTPIYSSNDGICLYAGFDETNGNMCQVWNETLGFKTLYGHNSELKIKQGDIITAGQLIALSGNTGASTGPHLHFGFKETNNDGTTKYIDNGFNGCVNPIPFMLLNYKGELLNKKNMTFKKIKGGSSIYLINETTKTRIMVVDMPTLVALSGEFDEVDNLSAYRDNGTLIWTERVIN